MTTEPRLRIKKIELPEQVEWPTEGRFRAWLAHSKPGTIYIYHVGHVAADRYVVVNADELTPIEGVDNIAKLAYEFMLDGTIHLLQYRLERGKHVSSWAYIAIKSKSPVPYAPYD